MDIYIKKLSGHVIDFSLVCLGVYEVWCGVGLSSGSPTLYARVHRPTSHWVSQGTLSERQVLIGIFICDNRKN